MEKRPYRERKEYLLRAVQNRRKKVRRMALEYMGNSCQKCGYNRCLEALEFHHLEKTEKTSESSPAAIPGVGKRLSLN
jgi:hypothetical protein